MMACHARYSGGLFPFASPCLVIFGAFFTLVSATRHPQLFTRPLRRLFILVMISPPQSQRSLNILKTPRCGCLLTGAHSETTESRPYLSPPLNSNRSAITPPTLANILSFCVTARRAIIPAWGPSVEIAVEAETPSPPILEGPGSVPRASRVIVVAPARAALVMRVARQRRQQPEGCP